MIWVIVVIVVAAILFFVLKPKAQPTVRPDTGDARSRAADLPPGERAPLAAEVRSTALNAYDTIAAAARNAGKDDAFTHQVGVLQALTAVVSTGRQPTGHDQRELQMETAPFNKSPPAEGRAAIAEYLVWKFFPEHADEAVFAPALRRFRDEIHDDDDAGDDVTFGLLYSMKYDWQRWLTEHRDGDDG